MSEMIIFFSNQEFSKLFVETLIWKRKKEENLASQILFFMLTVRILIIQNSESNLTQTKTFSHSFLVWGVFSVVDTQFIILLCLPGS